MTDHLGPEASKFLPTTTHMRPARIGTGELSTVQTGTEAAGYSMLLRAKTFQGGSYTLKGAHDAGRYRCIGVANVSHIYVFAACT